MGPGQFFVTHLWFEFGKFPLKISIFFPSGQEKSHWVGSKSTQVKCRMASYLLRVKSILGLGQGPSLVKTIICLWKLIPDLVQIQILFKLIISFSQDLQKFNLKFRSQKLSFSKWKQNYSYISINKNELYIFSFFSLQLFPDVQTYNSQNRHRWLNTRLKKLFLLKSIFKLKLSLVIVFFNGFCKIIIVTNV